MLNLPINLSILPREKYLGVTLENSYRQAVRPFSLLSAWSQFFLPSIGKNDHSSERALENIVDANESLTQTLAEQLSHSCLCAA